MKAKRTFLSMLTLFLSIAMLWAGSPNAPGLPALGNTRTGTPESGKQYYIYADTYYGGTYVNRYFYNNNGTLAMSATPDESDNNYVWTCTITDGKYTFQNVGNTAKYLGHKALADAAYNFTLSQDKVNHEGTTIYSVGASRYLITKNDGSGFDQSTITYDQTATNYCSDYVFVEYVTPSGNQLTVTTNYANAGSFMVNGTAATLPYTKWENTLTVPATLTATANNPYTFVGFFKGDVNLGTEYTIESLDEETEIEARYELDIFSTSLDNPIPVRINNYRNSAYVIRMNSATSYTGNAVNSGSGTYEESEIWYLVGTAESFKMYSRAAGTDLALTLADTGSGAAATLTATGTNLTISPQSNGTFGICPATNTAQSFNMHGGAGNNIKLYATTDGGSTWMFKKINTDNAINLNYNAQTAGGYEQNYKIGQLSINVNGTSSTTMLEKSTIPSSRKYYLPDGATFGISTGLICHGWTMDINGGTSIENQTIPDGGLDVDVNIAVDSNNKYQYLYYSPGPNNKPYRIPAIATTANGYVFAINDYRPCGGDIGNGDVDLVMRHSTAAGSDWDGYSWTDAVTIANGEGPTAHTNGETWKVGFGDPAIVADRVNNELLVMSVCGNRLCWDGNYGAGTTDNPENPNRVSRIRIKFNESTQEWVVGEPEEVTYDIYPLFDDEDGNHHVGSMFIGAGRIAQSSKIKVGTHYRIYCAVWAVATGSSRYHNYAIYSDDFGETWHLLGDLGEDYNDSPAPYGNEPKCEELPDGSVLLSSRKGYGRYFNVFHYTDIENGKGTWDGVVSTDAVGDLKWGANDTNGEPILIGNVLFQSAPTGSGRSDVALFYKVLSNDPADYTPTKLSNGWTKIAISDKGSAYSSMCILPDKESIGFFYEEEPGAYSMVYVPLKLKDILPADVYEALSALPPTYASESSPVWHQIKFSATGDILSDQGAGNNTATVTAEESDATMWNVVGTKDGFYLVSKLGNYLAYDATNNRYTTTADKSSKVALQLTENIKGSWEIMRKGASRSMSQITTARSVTGEVGDAEILGESNQIDFLDLTPKVYDPNIFSTEANPVWYNVQFKAGSSYIADQGAGSNLKTESANDSDKQYWQFIGTPEGFYMKSRLGNYVYYNGSRFATDATNKTELYLTANKNEGYYEIGRIGSANRFNQWGGAGTGKELGEWTAGDTNNPLRFLMEVEEPEIVELPYFSTEDTPEYWWLQFYTGSAVLADQGAGSNAITAVKSYTNAQLWQLVGDESSFYLKNKTGNYLSWNGSNFATSATATDAATLILHETTNANATGCYEIQLSGGNYMNQVGGTGAGRSVATWNAGDNNNPLSFVSAEPQYPNFSDNDNEYWYFIKFGNGGWVIEDKGAGNKVLTASIDDLETQKWKLVGTKENCQIVNKEGNYLVYESSRIKTSTSEDAQGFAIVVTENSSYPLMFEIQHKSSTTTAFNMNAGAGSGKEIALYNSNDSGNPLQFVPIESVTYPEFRVAESSPTAPKEKLTLWYSKPATATGVSNTWMEYSLPIGNGQFGGSLFGGVSKDEILFNDKTLWSGGPDDYGYYLAFGSVYIEDISGKFTYNSTKPVKNYYRDLNMRTATGTVTYEDGEGVKYTRQYIASNPDKAIVTKISASEAGKLSLRITMAGGKPTVNAETTYSNGYAQFTGKLQTVSYNATMKVVAKGGFTSTGAEGIIVEEADEVLIVLVGSTDFVGNKESHVTGNAANLPADNMAQADAVAAKGWDAVYAAHVADHQKYFNRVSFELDGVENNLPTNELINAYNAASGTRNLMLEQLYYNYGRYLEIASSRGADLPSNLQGIWNNSCTPPWHSDIHANINVQMNYWPAEAANLSEMHEPFLNYIINEAAQSDWQGVASNAVTTLNNSLGTSTTARGWTCLTENNIFGGVSTFATNYVIANAWYVTHLWQHYRYTLDKEFLSRAFPAMLGAAQFWADRMILAADGTYECPNEYSPEHGPNSENGVAHAQQIAWEALDNTIKAANILGGVTSGVITQDDYDLISDRLSKMDKGLATEKYTGNWGATYNGVATGDEILREWKYSTFTSGSEGHRHMSHLMALFPFGQLTPNSEYFEPAINSMKLRGDESTGWSMGWKINLWARALMGDRSHAILRKALKHSTAYGTNQNAGGIYYNLYDSHAPFQIDGNFGAASGINEMLLQSHTDVIDILPALPGEWSKGHIKGLKAIGDFTVDIIWENNQAREVTIVNNQGQPCYVKCASLSSATVTVNGTAVTLGEATTKNGLECYKIESKAGDEIVIDLSKAVQNDKSALEALIAQTESLINECYDYYATEAALQTTDASGDFYVTTNAQEDQEGPIANLVDGSNDTHFHSEYLTAINAKHYINIDLGNNATSSFMFKYATRKAQTNFPKTIEISGSTDGTNFELIETVTNLPVGNSSTNVIYTSSIIESETAYTQLRFTVTANNSGNTEASGNPFFHMAEFDLMLRTDEPVVNYTGALVTAAIENAQTEVETATAALNTVQTAIEYNATLAALQTAYDELAAAILSGNLPVLLTSDVNNPIVYKIGIKRGDTKVLQYDLASTGMVAVADYSEGNTLQGWYFTKGSTDDKVYIHPYVGGGDVLGADNTSNGAAKVSAVVKGSKEHEEWLLLLVNSDNGTYNIKAGDNSNYFSNNGGIDNKMGFYSGSNTTDTGSLFTFTRINFENGVWENTLDAYITHLCTSQNVVEGENPGYHTNCEAYKTARTAAVATLDDENSTENEFKSAYTELRKGYEAITIKMPEPGKYYTLRSKYASESLSQTNHYIFANASNVVRYGNAYNSDGADSRYIWQFEDNGDGTYKLRNVHTNSYSPSLTGTGAFSLSTDGTVSLVKYGTTVGAVQIKSGNYYYHANNGAGSDRSLIGWDAGAGGNPIYIEEAQASDISYKVNIDEYKWNTLYLSYPVTIPEGISAYTAYEADGDYIKLAEVSGVIPANTAVFVYSETEADYEFVYSADAAVTVAEGENLLEGCLWTSAVECLDGYNYYMMLVGSTGAKMYWIYEEYSEDGTIHDGNAQTDNGGYILCNANRAYMPLLSSTAAGTISYRFDFSGATGIDDGVTENRGEDVIFDLNGRRIKEVTAPGIYIVNGKKCYIKNVLK